MFEGFVHFVRELYGTNDFIPLHKPYFMGKEKQPAYKKNRIKFPTLQTV